MIRKKNRHSEEQHCGAGMWIKAMACGGRGQQQARAQLGRLTSSVKEAKDA